MNEIKDLNVTTIKDVFDACCEIPEDMNTTDTIVCISSGTITEGEEINVPVKSTFYKINLNMSKKNDYVEVCIIFKNHMDSKLNRTLQLLEQYNKALDETPEESNSFPSLHFSFMPLGLYGQFQLIMAEPIYYALCSQDKNNYPNCIKILFERDQIIILQDTALNYNEIIAEAKRQADLEDFYIKEESKKQEKMSYESEFHFNKAER